MSITQCVWRHALGHVSTSLIRSLTVGDELQARPVANGDPLATAFDDAGRFPCAHDPADRMQRGCRHLSDILTAHRKINQSTVRRWLPGLLGQFENRMSDAPLDVLG